MSKVIPPQAYTRNTLAEAYEWLKTQPSHLKGQATSADKLVSLYLHAKRNGLASETTSSSRFGDSGPLNVENFKI